MNDFFSVNTASHMIACESRRSGANASPGAWVMTTFSDSRRRFDNILFMTITKQRLFLFLLNGKHSACIIHSRSWSRVFAEMPRLHIALWNFNHLRRRDGEAFKCFIVCLNYIIAAWQQREKAVWIYSCARRLEAHVTYPGRRNTSWYWISKTNTKQFPITEMATMSVFTYTTKLD